MHEGDFHCFTVESLNRIRSKTHGHVLHGQRSHERAGLKLKKNI
jgi:hypothetical protein